MRRRVSCVAKIDAHRQPGLDPRKESWLSALFERHAAWGSAEAWDRYSYAHLKPIIDKTGRLQALIDAKGCVPEAQVRGFIGASLDYLINQLYRGLKCLRDGDPVASQLEAAEGVKPFLDAIFALHDGRLRPYYKYLAWELREETYPLERAYPRRPRADDRPVGRGPGAWRRRGPPRAGG